MDVQILRRWVRGATLLLALSCLASPHAHGAEDSVPAAEYGALGGWVIIPYLSWPQGRGRPPQKRYASPVGVRVEVEGTGEYFVINNKEGFFIVRAPLGAHVTLKITGTEIIVSTPTYTNITPHYLVESPIELSKPSDVGDLEEETIRRYLAEYRKVAEIGRAEVNPRLVALGEESLRRFGDYARLLNEQAAAVSAASAEESMQLFRRALWIHREAPTDEAAYARSLAALINALRKNGHDQEAFSALTDALTVDASRHHGLYRVAGEAGLELPPVAYFGDESPRDRSEVGLLELGKERKTFTVAVMARQVTKFRITGPVNDQVSVVILNDKNKVVKERIIVSGDDGVTWAAAEAGNYLVQVDASGAQETVYAAAQISAQASAPCSLTPEISTCIPPP